MGAPCLDEGFPIAATQNRKPMDAKSHQVIAFHVGDRSRRSARKLWKKIPEMHREQATFYTDAYQAYQGVIPQAQHRAINKKVRKTNHVERLNCTLRKPDARYRTVCGPD